MAGIDSSIYFQQQQPALPNPLAQAAQLSQLQGGMAQNQLAQTQLQRAQRQDQQEQGMNSALSSAYDPTTGQLDPKKAYAALAAGGQGGAIPGVQKTFAEQAKAAREAEKASLDNAITKQKIVAQVAGSVNDQASWDAGLQSLSQIGIDTSQIPKQYDPATASMLVKRSLSGVEQLDQVWKQKGYDLDVQKAEESVRHNKSTEANAAGQLGVAQGNLGVAQQGLQLRQKELQQGKAVPGYRTKPDGSMEAIPGGPADLKASAATNTKINDAKDVLSLLDEVDTLLPKATGSGVGRAIDSAGNLIGKSTEGAEATAQLKVLEGAIVSKMPKMSGPQSDKDVLLYREMAGQIADPSLPVSTRKKAAQTVRAIQNKYAGNSSSVVSNPSAKPSLESIFGK